MNESNGMAVVAGVMAAFADEDARRRAYLDKRCRELRAHPWPDKPEGEVEPLHVTTGRGQHKENVQTGIVCLKCHAKCLSERNQTGLCRACHESSGARLRAHYRMIREQGRAA